MLYAERSCSARFARKLVNCTYLGDVVSETGSYVARRPVRGHDRIEAAARLAAPGRPMSDNLDSVRNLPAENAGLWGFALASGFGNIEDLWTVQSSFSKRLRW